MNHPPSLSAALLLAAGCLSFIPLSASEVTYSRDIAPIMEARCAECHREGTGAPFALRDYDSVRRRARTMMRAIDAGIMPPWHAVGGDVELADDRRLAPEEITLLKSWVEAGMPVGDPADLPPQREFPEGWALGKPDLILTMKEGYTVPADGPDIYRHFVLPTGLSQDRWVKAVIFRPASPEVVHHALISSDYRGQARRLAAADPEPGFEGMPVGEFTGGSLGGWVPGAKARALPDGLARRVFKNGDLVVQLHLHPSGKEMTERSQIGIYFADAPPKRSFATVQLPPLFGAFAGIDLLPGEAETKVVDSFVLPIDVEAFGAQPHAHYRGKSLRMTAELPDGKTLTLLNIPNWDMDWQEDYRFAEKVKLPAGTRLTSTVTWDNSAEDPDNPVVPPVRVRWGFESFDEMGSVDLFVVADKGPMRTLRERYREHTFWAAGGHIIGEDKLASFGQLRESAIARFDANGDGEWSEAERAEARRSLREARP